MTGEIMPLQGTKVRVPQWIHGNTFVVHLEVDAVIPEEDPSEPCLEPDTLKFLDRLQSLADEGNVDALERYGTVYVRKSA